MPTVHAGNLVYEVDIDLQKMLEGSKEAQQQLSSLADAAAPADGALSELSSTAKHVSSALKMPEVNKLSAQLAQLTGKIGASSEAANDSVAANTKFSGVLSTVAGKLGAGYVSNVGSATASLIKHAKAALEATNAQVDNAKAAQQEAAALQSASSALVLKAAEEKKLAEAATLTAQNELLTAEAIFERKTAEIASLEALLTRQKESLKQAEANLTVSQSEKAVAEAIRARSAVDATSAKIQRQSNAAVKEVTQAEDRAIAAKEAAAAASLKLQSAIKLEATALTTVSAANDAATLATQRHTLATRAQAIAVSAARSALALLGGPTGVLLLAAGAVYSLYQAMRNNQDIEQFKNDIEQAAQKVEYLTEAQAKAAAAKTAIAIETNSEEITKTKKEIEDLEAWILKAQTLAKKGFSDYGKSAEDAARKLSIAQGKLESLTAAQERYNNFISMFTKRSKEATGTTEKSNAANAIYENTVRGLVTSNDLLAASISGTMSAAQDNAAIDALRQKLKEAGITGTEADKQLKKLKDELARKRTLSFQENIKEMENEVKALKIEMNEGAEAAAKYRAELEAEKLGLTGDEAQKVINLRMEQYKYRQALSESKKETAAATKANDEAAKTIEQLIAQNKSLTIGLEQGADAQFIHEAAVRAGTKATKEQLADVAKLATEQLRLRDAIRKKQEAEKEGTALATREIETAKAMELATKSQLEQIDISEQEKLAKIIAYQEQDQQNYQLYEDAKTAIAQAAANARKNIADEESIQTAEAISSMLNSASSGFDSLASIIESTAGTGTGAYKALFAASKAFAVGQATLSLNSAMLKALDDPSALTTAQRMANYAAVGAAGASLLSAISGATMGRYNGGPVSANSMYQVGENGKPEIFKASNGNQYMIPGNSGRVLSNRDITSGDGSGVTIQQTNVFNIETTGGISNETMQQLTERMKTVTAAVIKDNQRPGGMLAKSR